MDIKQQLFQNQLPNNEPLTKETIDDMISPCDETFHNDWVPGDIMILYFRAVKIGPRFTFNLMSLRYADLDRFLEEYEPFGDDPLEDMPRFVRKGLK